MSDDLWLNKDELKRLTGFAWKSKQCAALKEKKIPFTTNRFNEPLVVRAYIEGQGGAAVVKRKKQQPTEPNLAAIGLA